MSHGQVIHMNTTNPKSTNHTTSYITQELSKNLSQSSSTNLEHQSVQVHGFGPSSKVTKEIKMKITQRNPTIPNDSTREN